MTLQELSLFYNNMTVMLDSGVGLIQFIEATQRAEKNSERKKIYTFILIELKKGRSLHSTLRRTDLLPVFDLPIIESGEKSGKLPYIFNILSQNYARSAQAEKKIKAGLTVPFLMFIVSLFVPKFPKLFLGQITLNEYLFTNFSIILFVLFIYFFLYKIFMRSYFDIALARQRHQIFLYLPFLRGITQKMALEKFAASLALMLDAGLPLLEALSLSGQTSPEYQINLACRRIIAEIKSSRSMTNAFQMESIFNDDIINSITMGSESGKLPTFLQRSAELLQVQITTSIEKVSKAIPVLIYWFVVLYVAWSILSLYISNIAMLSKTLSGI